MSYAPHMFISIGETSAFFTLRESYLHHFTVAGRACTEARSHHHQNLAQDIGEAIEKATRLAAAHGLPLVGADRESLQQQMREIKRATADEIAERARREAQWEAERAQRAADWHAEQLAMIDNGLSPLRASWNRPIETLEREFLTWLVDQAAAGRFDQGSIMIHLAAAVEKHYAARLLPKPDRNKHAGKVGDRVLLVGTVSRSIRIEGQYGVSYFTTIVSNDGICFLSKGKFSAKVGDEIRVKATITKHDSYKDQAQTVINRVQRVDENGKPIKKEPHRWWAGVDLDSPVAKEILENQSP